MHESEHNDFVEVISKKGPAHLSGRAMAVFVAMMVVGFGTFAYFAFATDDMRRVGWIAFLHNLYIFTCLGAAGVVVAAILQTANANWGRPIKRYAESCGAFLPFAIVGVVVLWFGAEQIYEWAAYPIEHGNKAFWLQKPLVFVRVIGGLALLTFLAKWFSTHSDRPDFGLAHEHNESWPRPAHWRGVEAEVEAGQKRQSLIGPLYCVAFAVVVSLLSFDLIMSLDYRWFSTMFGGWNFTTSILSAWVSLYFITFFFSRRFEIEKYMTKPLYHDLGKLAFGFTVVWGYLFFAQYLVIWYGNLSHEAGYLLTRFEVAPWKIFSYTAFAAVFLFPFVLGLGKQRKMSYKRYAPVAAISVMGIWLERFVLIAPSSWYFDHEARQFMDGVSTLVIADVVVFIGFLGLFLFAFTRYLYKRPLMVISDPKLPLGINRH